jgi:CHAT domain-containing protein
MDFRGEGVLSLSRAWLDAGVPVVLASLWNVDDATSQVLFDYYYRALQATGDPVAALRQAQLDMLQSGDPAQSNPSEWAALAAFGASRGAGAR